MEVIGSNVGLLPLSGVEVIFGSNVLLGGLENLLLPANFFLSLVLLVGGGGVDGGVGGGGGVDGGVGGGGGGGGGVGCGGGCGGCLICLLPLANFLWCCGG